MKTNRPICDLASWGSDNSSINIPYQSLIIIPFKEEAKILCAIEISEGILNSNPMTFGRSSDVSCQQIYCKSNIRLGTFSKIHKHINGT
jgi:hypothetical protein